MLQIAVDVVFAEAGTVELARAPPLTWKERIKLSNGAAHLLAFTMKKVYRATRPAAPPCGT